MLLEIIIASLAVYGCILLIWQVWHFRGKKSGVFAPTVLIVVENAEQWIEWFLRKVSLELYSSGRSFSDIIIVDVSATIETEKIVSRMQRACPYVTYVPSSGERRWLDVAALIDASKRTNALFLEVRDEKQMEPAIRMIAHLFD